MSIPQSLKEALAKRIAGEIAFSTDPGVTMRKWREIFDISQSMIANGMKVSPSVISDYESGRRKSPGTGIVRRFVEVLIDADEQRGGPKLRELSYLTRVVSPAILDIKEFNIAVKASKICEVVSGVPVACEHLLNRDIFGYTVLDSIKAILELSGSDFYQILGSTTERALIFTEVKTGRSPMVAVRVQQPKPKMIVLHKPEKVDELAIELAKAENIPLVLSNAATVRDLLESLNNLTMSIKLGRVEL